MSVKTLITSCVAVAIVVVMQTSAFGAAEDVEAVTSVSSGILSFEAWAAVWTSAGFAALLTLTGLEIILGIDNIIFISVLTARLPPADRPRTRQLGLLVAMVSRVILLLGVGSLLQLTAPLFQVPVLNHDDGISGKDLILLGGGLFLLMKATLEIHHKVEGKAETNTSDSPLHSVFRVLVQIALIDVVFSIDSVVTAVGMTSNVPIMVMAIVASVSVMMIAANPISEFVERHPSLKILALSFLVLISVLLVAEGFGQHIEKGYVYFAMVFSLSVELLQLRAGDRAEGTAA